VIFTGVSAWRSCASASKMSDFGDEEEDEEGFSASGGLDEPQGSLLGSLPGVETSDLGDLSDVPHAYLREVVDLIRSLPSPEEEPGGLDQLKSWIQILSQKGAFSREATLQLLRAISQVIEAQRPKGAHEVTKESVQKAFVRVGGVKDTVDVMLMRLNDPAVVAGCLRVMTASVSGAPLAAEALHRDGSDKLRLMLRAIERHFATSFDVAEQGCLLISHLCAPVGKPGMSAAPVRGIAHRDSQVHLGHAGTLDLIAEILSTSVMEVKDVSIRTEQLQQKAADQAAIGMVASRQNKGGNASESVQRVKANIELRQAWVKLNTLEATAGRVQDAALQALVLLSFGNPEMMRMLAGVFWAWQSAREREVQGDVVAKMNEKRDKQTPPKRTPPKGGLRGSGPTGKLKDVVNGKMGAAMRGQIFAGEPPEPTQAELPEGEERCALSTFEGFTKCCALLLEVLRGRATRDRPHVAAKACRLLKALAEHYTELLRQIEIHRRREKVALEATLYGAPVPEDNRQPKAPFAPLSPVVSGLMHAVRIHKEDAPFLADAMAALKCVKDLALVASPAGVANNSDTLLYAWQGIMAENEEKDELTYAQQCLKRAVETTDTGNERRRMFGCSADALTGEGIYLTPRMREAVSSASALAAEMSGDSMASRWSKGDPDRRKRRAEALKHAEEVKAQEAKASRRQSSKSRGIVDMSARSTGSSGRGSVVGTARRGSSKEASPGKKSLGFSSRRGSKNGSQASASPASSLNSSARGLKAFRAAAEEVAAENKHVRDHPRGSTEVPRLLAAALQTLHEGAPQHEHSTARSTKRGAMMMSAKDLNKGLKKLQGGEQEEEQPVPWNRAIGYGVHDETDFDRIWRKPLEEVMERSLSMPAIGVGTYHSTRLKPMAVSDTIKEDSPFADESEPLPGLDLQLVKSEPGVMKTRIVLPSQDRLHQTVSEQRLKELLDPKVAARMVTQNLSKHLRKSGLLLPEYGIQVVIKKGRRPPPALLLGQLGGSHPSSQATSHNASRTGSRAVTPSSKKLSVA